MKSILLNVLKVLYLLGLIFCLICLYLGVSSIISTIFIYIAVLWFFRTLINEFGKRNIIPIAKSVNLKLILTSTLITLMVSEVALRFVVRRHLTYTEQNGYFAAVSPYASAKLHEFNMLKDGLWIHKKGTTQVNSAVFSYKHHYNDFGIREDSITPQLIEDTSKTKILALGDSFTEGMGTTEDSTWVKQLEVQLNGNDLSKSIKSINGGVIGSDPVFCRQLYNRKLSTLNANIVILAINGTDIMDVFIKGGVERYVSEKVVRYKKMPLRGYFNLVSYIARIINFDLLGYNRILLTDEETEDVKLKTTETILNEILLLKETVENQNGHFLVVLHPKVTDFEEGAFYIQPLVDAIKEGGDISYLDLYQSFQEKINEDNLYEYYWRIDKHHNNKGYDLFANEVGEYLLEQGWLE